MPTSWRERTTLEAKAALQEFVDQGGAPGGVVAFGEVGAGHGADPVVVSAGIVAPECGDAPPGGDTLYDVASLTKVLATWPLVGLAIAENRLELDAPVGAYLPASDSASGPSGAAQDVFDRFPPDRFPSAGVTVRQLLSHTSGLMVRTRLDRYLGESRPLAELICAEPLEWEPGSRHKYISRSFILLGLLLPCLLDRPFERAAAELVWRPAGMRRTAFAPVSRGSDVAPTEQPFPGAPRIWGQVHDENARLLGGVAGHAGVFSTAADLAAYAASVLDPQAPLHPWLRQSVRREVPVPPSNTPTEGSPVGTGLARGLAWLVTDTGVAFHDGFTGPSLFLAPETGRYLALCTNAVYHGRSRRGLRALRRRLLDLVQAPSS